MILLVGNYSYGQDTLKSNGTVVLVKTSPFLIMLGDYITASIGIPIDIEIKIKNNLSFDQKFTYIVKAGDNMPNSPNMASLTHNIENINGIRTDSEIKRYLNERNNFTGFYLSTHLLYQYTDSKIMMGGFQKTYRNLIALHEKIGWQSISKNGFVFDVAIGIGTRYIYSKSNCTNQLYIFNEYPYNKPYQYGSKWFFSFNGSFKIGWLINFYKNK